MTFQLYSLSRALKGHGSVAKQMSFEVGITAYALSVVDMMT